LSSTKTTSTGSAARAARAAVHEATRNIATESPCRRAKPVPRRVGRDGSRGRAGRRGAVRAPPVHGHAFVVDIRAPVQRGARPDSEREIAIGLRGPLAREGAGRRQLALARSHGPPWVPAPPRSGTLGSRRSRTAAARGSGSGLRPRIGCVIPRAGRPLAVTRGAAW
jgi:hypothetical protein